MGYDISYHPIKETELNDWYFNLDLFKILDEDYSELEALARLHGIDDFYLQKYKDLLKVTSNIEPDEAFENTYGYFAAVAQGYFKQYFYIRGGVFSFLIADKPYFSNYTKPWEEILSYKYDNPIYNRINNSYSSGVYIPADKALQLWNDYQTDPQVKKDLEAFFSFGRLSVFLKALQFAITNGDGILEATEVIEPNPLNLNESSCYSNLFNCDPEGALLYQQTANQQLAEIEQREGLETGEIAEKASYVKTQVSLPKPASEEKKGFFKRLFGK
jgi:hypothetical protein